MKPEEKVAVLAQYKARLESHIYGDNHLGNLAFIAAIITSTCRELQITIPVVVGGFAVEIYTMSEYLTHDLDLVTTATIDTQEIMAGLGFQHEVGFRHWTHPSFDAIVEFLPPPLFGSQDRVVTIAFDTNEECHVICVEDAILNRLEEFAFWDHNNLEVYSAAQLRLLLTAHGDTLDWEYLRRQAAICEVDDSLDLIIEAIENNR